MNMIIAESTTGKVPELLQNIIEKVYQGNEKDIFQKDLLFLLVVALMIENGMELVNNNIDIINPIILIENKQLTPWKSRIGIYESLFIVSGFKNVTFRLTMSPLGGVSILNAVIKDLNSETYTICLPISRYIVSPLATSIPMKFRDLKHFAMMVKNKIISPVKSRILTFYGYASASLIGLPEEILFKILLYMPIKDVLNTCKTCSQMKYLLCKDTLWHSLSKRDFGDELPNDKVVWKNFYEFKYEVKRVEDNPANRNRIRQRLYDFINNAYLNPYGAYPIWDIRI